jgi:DNA-binding MarR family transcriptional regulator
MSALPAAAGPGWISRWNLLARQLRRILADRYAEVGLNETRVVILEALREGGTGASQADLAGDLQISESSLCVLVERMRHEGLLRRERSALDRRKTVLQLTPLGMDRCRTVETVHLQLERQLQEQTPELLTELSEIQEEVISHRPQSAPDSACCERSVA